MDKEPESLAEWAVWYAEHGLKVLPLLPRSKVPATVDGVYGASSDVNDVRECWEEFPECNVGLVMGGGWVAIDIDCGHANGLDGWDDVNAWERENGELAETWRSITGSGGQHMVYRTDVDFTNAVGKNGVDIKAAGGYIVVPPSVNECGNTYEWECGYSPLEIKAAAADENVKRYIHTVYPQNTPHTAAERATAASGGRSVHGEHGFQLPTVIGQGQRDETLYKYACQLQQFGWTDDAITREIETVNDQRCEPPMSAREIKRILSSAFKQPKGESDDRVIDMEALAAKMAKRREERSIVFAAGAQNIAGMPPIVPLGEMGMERPPLRPAIIEGVLRENSKMLVQGASKAGKTWLMVELAIAMATGSEWMGIKCRKGRVLYMNFELHQESFMNRFFDVCGAMGIDAAEAMDNIDLWNLRGFTTSMSAMNKYVFKPSIERGKYQLIIIDPFYKLMTGSENDAEIVGEFCRELESLCVEMDVAAVYVHHYSKGAKGDVSPMDRSSGSGVFARDADAIIDMAELDVSEVQMPEGREGAMGFRVTPVLRDFEYMYPFDVFFTPGETAHDRDTEGVLSDSVVDSPERKAGKKSGEARTKKAEERYDAIAVQLRRAILENGGSVRLKDFESDNGISHKVMMCVLDHAKGITWWHEITERNAVFARLE